MILVAKKVMATHAGKSPMSAALETEKDAYEVLVVRRIYLRFGLFLTLNFFMRNTYGTIILYGCNYFTIVVLLLFGTKYYKMYITLAGVVQW